MVQRVDRVAMTVTSVLLCGNFLMFVSKPEVANYFVVKSYFVLSGYSYGY